VIWPRFLAGGRYLSLDGSAGGFRRRGRLEDGVLDLGLTTFSPLQRGTSTAPGATSCTCATPSA
jgi:hypothetical protein